MVLEFLLLVVGVACILLALPIRRKNSSDEDQEEQTERSHSGFLPVFALAGALLLMLSLGGFITKSEQSDLARTPEGQKVFEACGDETYAEHAAKRAAKLQFNWQKQQVVDQEIENCLAHRGQVVNKATTPKIN